MIYMEQFSLLYVSDITINVWHIILFGEAEENMKNMKE